MYVLDSNVFIEAKNRYYGFDIAPGFWDWLGLGHSTGSVCSIEPVRDELVAGDDPLAAWAAAHGPFFRPVDAATIREFPMLTQWANSQSYSAAAISEFLGAARYECRARPAPVEGCGPRAA